MKKMLRFWLLAALMVPLGVAAQSSECTAITVTASTPFHEAFEGSAMPACWTTEGPGTWAVGTGDYYTSTGSAVGSGNAKITHGTTGNQTKLISPVLDLSSMTSGFQISFWQVRRAWGSDIDGLNVYYRLSETSEWVLIQAFTEATSTWVQESLLMDSLATISATMQFAFEFVDDYGYGCGIDDIIIGAPPACFPVQSFGANVDSHDEVTLTWTDTVNTAATYTITYFAVGSTDTSVISDITGSTYTVTGLDASTTYTFSIVADCSDGSIVMPMTATVTTDCDGGGCIYTFEMVDDYGDGWNGNAFDVYLGNTRALTATISSGSTNTIEYQFCSDSPDTLRIVYIAGSYADEMSGTIKIGSEVIFNFADIHANSIAGGTTVVTMNKPCPTCSAPQVSDSLDADGNVVLSWVSNASQFVVYLGDSIVDDNVTSNEYTFYGLPGSSFVTLGVAAICDVDDTSRCNQLTVATPCAPIDSLPWANNFEPEQTGGIPMCWNLINSASDWDGTVPAVRQSTYYASSGTQYLHFYGQYGDDTNLITTPAIMANPAALQISFSVYPSFYGGGSLQVGVMTNPNDISTFTAFATINSTTSTAYSHNSFEFFTEGYVSEVIDTAYVAFLFVGGSNGSSSYAYVDDVVVSRMPECRMPFVATGVIDSITYQSAHFSWEGPEGAAYDVKLVHYEYDVTGAITNTVVEHFSTDTTCITVNTLLDSTTYQFSVATVCDDDTTTYRDFGSFLTHNRSYPVMKAHITAVAASAAGIAWTVQNMGVPAIGTLLTLTDLSDPSVAPVVETVTENSKLYTGLVNGHNYSVSLRVLCGPSDTSVAKTLYFTPHIPECAQYLTDAQASNTSSTSPLYYYANYTLSQTLYRDTVLNGLDTLNGLAWDAYFYNDNVTGLNNYTVDVFLGFVDTDSLDYIGNDYYFGTNYFPVTSMTKVVSEYNLSVGSNGWVYIPFDSAWAIPTHSNDARLVVSVIGTHTAVDGNSYYNYWKGMNDNYYNSSTYSYSYKSRYCYSTSTPYTAHDFATSSSYGSSVVPNIQFFGNCSSGCFTPTAALDYVGPNSVTVSWFANGDETSWLVEHKAATDSIWTVDGVATSSPYTFSGLTPSTDYLFRLGVICGSDTAYTNLNATTSCAAVMPPYTVTFSAADPCWYSNTTPNSTYGYNIYSSNFVVSPEVALPLDTLMLRITDRCYSTGASNQTYAIYACDANGTNPELITTATATEGSLMGTHNVFLTNYTGTKRRFCINSFSGGDVYIYQIEILVAPSCMAPDSVSQTASTTNSISISWDGGYATDFRVSYRPAGDTTVAWVDIDTNVSSLTITGLATATRYEVAVYTYCSDGTLSNANVNLFNTECNTISAPFTQYFNEMPVCWSTHCEGNATTSWEASGADAFYNNYIYSHASSVAAPVNDWLISPAITIPVDAATMSYNIAYQIAGITGSGTGAIASYQLLVSPTGTNVLADFTDTLLVDTVSSNNFAYRYLPLTAYAGQTIRFAIRSVSNRSSSIGVFEAAIRNIDAPLYYMSGTTQLYAGDTGTYWVTRIEGDTTTVPTYTWTSNMIAAGQATLINVSGDTVKIAYTGAGFDTVQCVVANSFGQDTNKGTVTIYDLNPVSVFPYSTGFETTDNDNSSWILLQGNTNRWTLGSATNSEGSRALYISNNNGTSNNYTEGTAAFSYALRAIDVATPGQYNFGFDWKCNGESNYDYIRAWLVPGNVVFTPDQKPNEISSDYNCVSETPTGWVDLANGKMNLNGDSWTSVETPVTISDSGRYILVFMWRNDYSVGNNPAGAIDNVTIITDAAQPECLAPMIVSDTAFENEISFTFTGTADNYEVAIVEGTWIADSVTPVATTDTTYTFNGLTANTEYTVGVRAVCAGGLTSDWVTVTLTTAEHPCFVPTNVTTSLVTFDGVTVGWTPGENETSWEVNVTGPSYDQTFATTTNPYDVTGLNAGETYTVKVRAICSETQQSDWSEPAQFTTERCQPVSGVAANATEPTTATVTWNPASNGNGNYEVEYGMTGFRQGNGTRVTVNGATTYTLTGLDENSSYDVYVRTFCDATLTSEWSSVVTFTTPEEVGIDNVEGSDIALYPNPARTTVTINGLESGSTITVVDLNGRVVLTSTDATLDISDLTQGAYFVRIVGERQNAIRKLIVK